mgnify:FL=1
MLFCMLSGRPAESAEPAAAPAAVAPQPHMVSDSVMFGSVKQTSTAATTDKQQQQQPPQQQQQDVQEQQEASSKVSRATRSAAGAAAAVSTEQQALPRTRRSSQRLSQPPATAGQDAAGAAGADAAEAGAAVEPAGNATDCRLAALGVTDPEAVPMFLERVVLWWCGVPEGSAEHFELQTILHAYAGVRFPEIQDITTHIMVSAGGAGKSQQAQQQLYAGFVECTPIQHICDVSMPPTARHSMDCAPAHTRPAAGASADPAS